LLVSLIGVLFSDVCLQVFLIATKQISQSKTPLVHEVIPIFDVINRALDEHLADMTLPAAVCMAAARGRTMLNKYYGLTDDSIIYWIAMCTSYREYSLSCWLWLHKLVLHPRYKSSYFHKAGWPREWITMAEDLLRNEWNANYKPKTIPTVTTPAMVMHLYSVCIYMIQSSLQVFIGFVILK